MSKAEPLAAFRGSGAKPPESENFSALMPKGSGKFSSFSVFYKLASQAPNVIDSPPPKKNHWICINPRNNTWQKWG